MLLNLAENKVFRHQEKMSTRAAASGQAKVSAEQQRRLEEARKRKQQGFPILTGLVGLFIFLLALIIFFDWLLLSL